MHTSRRCEKKRKKKPNIYQGLSSFVYVVFICVYMVFRSRFDANIVGQLQRLLLQCFSRFCSTHQALPPPFRPSHPSNGSITFKSVPSSLSHTWFDCSSIHKQLQNCSNRAFAFDHLKIINVLLKELLLVIYCTEYFSFS